MKSIPRALIVLLVIAGVYLEGLIFIYLLNGSSLKKITVCHSLAMAFGAIAFILKLRTDEKKGPDASRVLYCLVVSTFFPLIGTLFSIVFLASFILFGQRMKEGVYEDFDEYLFDFSIKDKNTLNQGQMNQKARDELGFEPLTDIMMGSETKLKIKAVDKLTKNVRIENVRLLQKATKDAAHEVRLYASSALLKMEASIGEKINFAMSASNKLQTAESYADLGNLYKAYAESGFLEATLASHYLQLATDAYRISLDKRTNQPEIVANFAICLMQTGNDERAMKILNKMTDLWPDNQKLIFLSAKARFQSYHTAQVAGVLSKINIQAIPEAWIPTVKYWTT